MAKNETEVLPTRNYVVKTLSMTTGASDKFEKMFDKLVKHAAKNKLKAPKKSELITHMIEKSNITPEQFF